MKTLSINKVRSVLIVAGPGIGDAFLATPIASSLLSYNPDLKIDFLVRYGTGGLLQQCSELSEVIEFHKKAKIKNYLSTVKRIFRKYDLAIATNTSDRSILATFHAAPIRLGIAPPWSFSSFWKHWILNRPVIEDLDIHVVTQNLQLIDLLEIPVKDQCLLPLSVEHSEVDLHKEYAVINIRASGDWKNWNLAAWREVIKTLKIKGLRVYLVGGNSDREKTAAYSLAIDNEDTVVSLVGKTNFGQLRYLLTKAKVFIGIDSFLAHLAAQCGIPTITIYGPTNPKRWGPRAVKNSKEAITNPAPDVTEIGNVFTCKATCFCENAKSRCFYHDKVEPYCLRHYSADTVCGLIKRLI